MKNVKVRTSAFKMLADMVTPVSIYLKLRDTFPNSLLLESSDYHGNENSWSYICFNPVASFVADNNTITEVYPDGTKISTPINDRDTFSNRFSAFSNAFVQESNTSEIPVNGLFGYVSYDAVRYFEKISFRNDKDIPHNIPDARYSLFKYIIAINHFQNTLQIIENCVNDETPDYERIIAILNSRNSAIHTFTPYGEEHCNMSDEDFREMVRTGRKHCLRGDVFQIVLSREFSQGFTGDEFNVYRALRSINPSPYLFYFDYGSYRIFGSSPEAHLKIKERKAYINPIAGTFRRTGDDENDKIVAERLSYDTKENAEHIMLVDLARNDLSRYADNVKVENQREIQFFSHVIHLVSSVSGELKPETTVADMLTSTFPAGTLTGAPKHMAMQLIDRYEHTRRGFYGGAIGFIDFRGNVNHAIMIRTFLSSGNKLCYQAGAGVVAASDENNELQEVNNKLGALKKAIEMAGGMK